MLVEAMKTFNEIKARKRRRGETRSSCENGAPVEFGEVLAIVE